MDQHKEDLKKTVSSLRNQTEIMVFLYFLQRIRVVTESSSMRVLRVFGKFSDRLDQYAKEDT